RLDNGLTRFQLAALFRRLDNPERQPVLDRAQRVERLDLDVEIDVRRRQIVDSHHRRVADGLENARVAVSHLVPCWLDRRAGAGIYASMAHGVKPQPGT